MNDKKEYVYFVCYFSTYPTSFGFGNAEIRVDLPLDNYDAIEKIQDDLKERSGKDLVIICFQLLGEPRTSF